MHSAKLCVNIVFVPLGFVFLKCYCPLFSFTNLPIPVFDFFILFAINLKMTSVKIVVLTEEFIKCSFVLELDKSQFSICSVPLEHLDV